MSVKSLNVASIVFGIIASLGTATVFTACPVHDDGTIGRCVTSQHWIFAIGLGIIFMQFINMIAAKKSKVANIMTHAISCALYIVMFLVPNCIVGVCMKPNMICRKLMLPTVNIISVIGIIMTLAVIARIIYDSNKNKN